MHLTRLELERADGTTLDLEFAPGLNVVDLTADDLDLVGEALRELFAGTTTFGRAWMAVEDIEIEITPEIAHLLPSSVAQPIVELATMTAESGPALTAVRAGLELLDVVPRRLDRFDVDTALAVTRDEHDMIVQRAERTLDAAVDAAHTARTRRDLVLDATGPTLEPRLGFRRSWRRTRQEAEARAAREHVELCVELAEAALIQAQEELDDARSETSESDEVRTVVARKVCLELRRFAFTDGELVPAERDTVRTALEVLRPLDARRLANDSLIDAALWLEYQEARHVDDLLLARAARNCRPHPVLGIVPLIVDPGGEATVTRLRETVGELNDELQVIHLGRLAD